MRIDGNTLAKYLVMVSQVIAWCTVSMMLLRRGLNQVHGARNAQSSLHDTKAHERSTAAGATVGGGGGGVVNAAGDATAATANATAATATANATAAAANDAHQGPGKPLDGGGTPAVVAGVVMIAIAAIMLIVSPVIMLMKVIEKRKKRVLETELESPPKYEDVVESAPRYSSLFVFNTDGEMTLMSGNHLHKDKENI